MSPWACGLDPCLISAGSCFHPSQPLSGKLLKPWCRRALICLLDILLMKLVMSCHHLALWQLSAQSISCVCFFFNYYFHRTIVCIPFSMLLTWPCSLVGAGLFQRHVQPTAGDFVTVREVQPSCNSRWRIPWPLKDLLLEIKKVIWRSDEVSNLLSKICVFGWEDHQVQSFLQFHSHLRSSEKSLFAMSDGCSNIPPTKILSLLL